VFHSIRLFERVKRGGGVQQLSRRTVYLVKGSSWRENSDATAEHDDGSRKRGFPKMTMMRRREWLHAAAATAGAAVATAAPWTAEAGQAKTPAAPKAGYPSRPAGKVEMLFKAPGQSANGMQCTEEGIWTIENAGSRTDTPGRCKVYLSSYEGKLLRELAPEGTGHSLICVVEDNRTFWIVST
jgi:hypothetical protein